MAKEKEERTFWRVTIEGFVPVGAKNEELAALLNQSVCTSFALHSLLEWQNVELVSESLEQTQERRGAVAKKKAGPKLV
jgi:hypothetical protein